MPAGAGTAGAGRGRGRPVLKRFLIAIILLLAAAGTWLLFQSILDRPMALPDEGLVIDVPVGTTLAALGERLAAEGVLGSPRALRLHARMQGQAHAIKAGEYELAPGTTPRKLLQQLVEGRARLHSLTIIEGWTTHDLLLALRQAEPLVRQTLDGGLDGLAALLDFPGAGVEGWFFPDTYRFPRGTSDRDILRMAHLRMQQVLARAWEERAPGLALQSPYEALILASIIEKETGLDRERAQVAGVFLRRLQTGMRLQTDPTVIYGLGPDFKGRLRRRDLDQDTPYNTYTRMGLPPTPISLPGEASIRAALHPDDSDALYFVASPAADGSHVFSANLHEHNAAVKKYLEALRKARP